MIPKGFLLLAVLLAQGMECQARNIALQMGGNCESDFGRKGEDNIFLKDMTQSRLALEKMGWETHTLYNGDTAPFVEKFKKMGGRSQSVGVSNREKFFAKLDEMIDQVKSGPAGANQVILHLSTHGFKGGVCISETETLPFDDAEFQQRLEKLNAKSKIGVLVDACYSGSAIPALSKYGCVIASQAGTAFGTKDSGVTAAFLEALAGKKTTLEDFYLNLQAYSTQNLPQMSGFSEGARISEVYLSQFSNLKQADLWKTATASSCEKTLLPSHLNDLFKTMSRHLDDKKMRHLYGNKAPDQNDVQSILDDFSRQEQRKEKYRKINDQYKELARKLSDFPNPELQLKGAAPTIKELQQAFSKIDLNSHWKDLHIVSKGDGFGITLAAGLKFGSEEEFKGKVESAIGSLNEKLKPRKLGFQENDLVDFGKTAKARSDVFAKAEALRNSLSELESEENLFLGRIENNGSFSLSADFSRQVGQVSALNQHLAALYLNGKRRKLSAEDRERRDACRNFKLNSR